MGGFTVIYLKDRSEENIRKHNKLLKQYKVAKKIHFYSMENVQFEYDSFMKGLGVFPDQLFPKDKINTLEDFCKYWSPVAVGEVFVPYNGSMTFDCYYGRTSKRAMRNIGKYIYDNYKDILAVYGSFNTFMEYGMTKSESTFINVMIKEGKIKDTSNIKNVSYEHCYPYENPYYF